MPSSTDHRPADIRRIGVGPRLSAAVVHAGTVYLAGQVAVDTIGKSVPEQSREILARIDGLLAEAGSDKTRLLSVNIYIADLANFAAFNEVWDGWIVAGTVPARTTIEAKLAGPGYAIEIGVIAAA